MYKRQFLNTKEPGFQGTLHYGVNDFGILVGIPILGIIQHTRINRMFQKAFTKIRCYDSHTHQLIPSVPLSEWISLSIEPISILEDSYLEECEAHCRQKSYLYKKGARRERYQQQSYQKRYTIYQNQLNRYSGKLQEMIQTRYHREGINQFIHNSVLDSSQHSIYQPIILLLQSNEYIVIPTGESLTISKQDRCNVIYWLVKYKDFHSLRVQKERPPRVFSNNPYCLSTIVDNISYMSFRFHANNPKLTWWKLTMKVTVPSEEIISHKDFYYQDPKTHQWKYRIRNKSHEIPGVNSLG